MTLVDRVSKYTIIRKIPNKTALAVENAMNDSYDNSLIPFITVTYDNGTEFAKTDFANINKTHIEHVQNLLNNRPRKSLGFLTPNEVVNKDLTRSYKKLSQLT